MNKFEYYLNYFCGFINFDIKTHDDLPDILVKFEEFCESYEQITNYYLIAHYETNVPHIHFLFYCKQHVKMMTIFNKLRSLFVPNLTRDENGITINKCESINSHLRYLVHQDKESIQLGKKVYNIEDFVSNDDPSTIENYIRSKKGQVDAYLLRDIVLESKHDFDIMVKLGLTLYHRYRNEIKTIQEERAFLEMQRKKEREETSDNELPF